MACPLLSRSTTLWKIAQGLSEDPGSNIELHKLAPAQDSLCRLFSSSHQFVNLHVYLCAKFGALSGRINETRSSEKRSGLISQVQPPRFSILPITWLSDLSSMINRSSMTIMDISQHASEVVYASWPYAIKRPQHHTLDIKFH